MAPNFGAQSQLSIEEKKEGEIDVGCNMRLGGLCVGVGTNGILCYTTVYTGCGQRSGIKERNLAILPSVVQAVQVRREGAVNRWHSIQRNGAAEHGAAQGQRP